LRAISLKRFSEVEDWLLNVKTEEKKLELREGLPVSLLSDAAAKRREMAIARLKVVVPALFALGFLFYSAITVFPLAGMPSPPLDPLGGTRPLLLWLGAAGACGSLFALFGGLIVALAASSDDYADG
jgi:hypothetical protein